MDEPKPAEPRIVALVLAAGASRRFGSDKRRVQLAGGETLLQASCAPVLAAGLPLYIALRPEDDLAVLTGSSSDWPGGQSGGSSNKSPNESPKEPSSGSWTERVERINVRRADRGMGASLAEAVAALPPDTAGCLVLLADMPGLRANTLRVLAAALAEGGEGALVAPLWQGQRGHPVGFGRQWFGELQQLDGDRGARQLLERDADRLHQVPVADPGVLRDVDTVADLIRLHSPAEQ